MTVAYDVPKNKVDDKFQRQEAQYAFPYHYLPDLVNGVPTISQRMLWGIEYLTYMQFVKELIVDKLKPTSLIDVGCGDGRLVHMLEDQVPNVVGVDLAEQAIALARAFNPEREFHAVPVSQVPGEFDVATMIEVMEHISDEDLPQLISDVADRLSPKGHLVISVPTTNMPINVKHYRHYTVEILNKQISAHFEMLEDWFVVRNSLSFSLITGLICNRLFELRPRSLRRAIWNMHKTFTATATPANGRHLIILARKR